VGITPVSSHHLKDRRQNLKNRRRQKSWLAIGRTMVVMSLAGGLVWLVRQPNWVIHSSSQVEIKGNEFLTPDEIRQLMPLSYPQPLLKLNSVELIASLKTKIPIANATISRELLPPKLTLTIKERPPVARAFALTKGISTPSSRALEEVGFIDEKGILVPKNFYSKPDKNFSLPTLKIIGFSAENRNYWEELYRQIVNQPVKVTEIDWREPTNLILTTELGRVHFGAYTSVFPEQLQTLAKMGKLPSKVNSQEISHIDLKSLSSPAVQLKPKPKTGKEQDKAQKEIQPIRD
jgi:cell division protein FtsQ